MLMEHPIIKVKAQDHDVIFFSKNYYPCEVSIAKPRKKLQNKVNITILHIPL